MEYTHKHNPEQFENTHTCDMTQDKKEKKHSYI